MESLKRATLIVILACGTAQAEDDSVDRRDAQGRPLPVMGSPVPLQPGVPEPDLRNEVVAVATDAFAAAQANEHGIKRLEVTQADTATQLSEIRRDFTARAAAAERRRIDGCVRPEPRTRKERS